MTEEDNYDNFIDKAIDEALQRSDPSDEDIKSRKPKPFRYITNQEELKETLSLTHQKTVMKRPDAPKIVDNQWKILSQGDNETIEKIVRRHIDNRKFK